MARTIVIVARMLRPSLSISFCVSLTLGASCGRAKTDFDGKAALGYAKTQLEFGPRVPGTEAHRRAGDWIVAQMRGRADTVVVQSWTHIASDGRNLPLMNVLARFRLDVPQRVLYVTHWDTRPTSDQDMVVANRKLPIAGANDGASGVGLLVALGDALKKTRPTVGVDLLFVDGEDYGSFAHYNPDSALTTSYDVLIGSTYFANHLPSAGYKPLFGVLWDMIGDRDLQLYEDGTSVQHAPEVVQRVWETAQDLGYQKYFIPELKGSWTDDHVPLIARGLRVIDVIDGDYCAHGTDCPQISPANYHHTQQDTFDKISAHSLQVVGDVATALVTN